VGAALNVHEGPQRISMVLADQALLPGMIVSNEPGEARRFSPCACIRRTNAHWLCGK